MKKIFVIILIGIIWFILVSSGENKSINDYEKLKAVHNKIIEYYEDENVDRSNLAAYYLDIENNIVVIELIDNSKEKQKVIKKAVKVDSKYLKFVQGGPYYGAGEN